MPNTSRFFKSLLVFSCGALLYSGGAMAQIDKSDASMLEDIARANLAEIESGKLAVSKSKSAQVRNFAQMMVDDHSKGLADVQDLATKKNVTLPKSPDTMHKAALIQLKGLRGNMFDSRYVKQAGVGDHEATVKLLQKTQTEAKDPDVKAIGQKLLPIVQAHLAHARELEVAQK